MKVNTSYGISLVKKNKLTEEYEILFIKKRSSYSYITFTKGIYFNYLDIKKLFNTMTLNEKLIILSLDFKNIWFNCYLKYPINSDKKYIKAKKKFEKFFQRGGYNIIELLSETRNIELIWEIPKGYCDPNESNIDSAIREFYEETNIHKSKYRILWDVKPITYVFSDNNITYKYIYYIAIMQDNMYIPRVNYSTSMMTETLDIKFLSLNMMRSINPNYKFMALMKKIIKIVKNKL